jgi:hypothetical protein
MEDGARQLQEEDRRIGEEIMKNVELWNELNTLKQEHTWEVWLLKIYQTRTRLWPRLTEVTIR